jgi:hypothetical protein
MKTTCELESGSFLGVALVVVFHERERERRVEEELAASAAVFRK